MKAKKSYFYVQQGGSSTEGLYVHGFDSKREATRSRSKALNAAYACGEIIPVDRALADMPGFDEFVQKLVESSP